MRFAVGSVDVLEPFTDEVNRNFTEWMAQQEKQGKQFTPEQKEWLKMIKEHITTSLSVGMDDFENVPFNQKGGVVKAYQVLGQDLNRIMKELNMVLTR